MNDTNYNELLEQKAESAGDKPFILFYDETITYREMNERSNQVANALAKLGAGPGFGVANMLPNSPETLYTHFAIQKLGAYSVPVNTELKGEHLSYILDHSESRILVTHQGLLPAFENIKSDAPNLEHAVVSTRDTEPDEKAPDGVHVIQDWLEKESIQQNELRPQENDIAMIMYTSGTTGRAKGVLYRYGRIGLNKVGLLAKVLFKPDDVLYTCLPLFHANAIYVSVPSAMWNEAPLAVSRRFSASRFWDETRDYGATTFNALGAMIPILAKQPEKPDDSDNPIRLVISAACPASLWEKFEARFGLAIWEFYGAVDGGGNAVFNMGTAPVGSIGPLPRPAARVVDEDMNDVAANTPGELVFKVPEKEKVVEYFKNDEATNEKVRDGYLHTGDLVYYDDKDFLYFVDRKSDNMRRRGENISSFEVETLVEKFPSVLEAAAYSIPSDVGEDDVMVAVVPKPGETVDPEALYDFCTDLMPRYMIPRYLRIMDSFPKTETHRVKKAPLKNEGVTADTWDEETALGRRK